ncbi:MAG TPA: hypothetical protein VM182_04345 [Terriglobia bacterium]|nr:hypothetical protein [Terriglobia bacterium]
MSEEAFAEYIAQRRHTTADEIIKLMQEEENINGLTLRRRKKDWDEATRQAEARSLARIVQLSVALGDLVEAIEFPDKLAGYLLDAAEAALASAPDPNFLEREWLKARLDEAEWWHKMACVFCRKSPLRKTRLAKFKRELALLSQGAGGLAAMRNQAGRIRPR